LDEILSDFVKGIALALEPIGLRGSRQIGRFDLETLHPESDPASCERQIRDFVANRKTANPYLGAVAGSPIT
jgi:hypothetical protein